jgi:hypothetical protein
MSNSLAQTQNVMYNNCIAWNTVTDVSEEHDSAMLKVYLLL